MPSSPKPVKKSMSSAAKVRMADEKMTKAANAKAPRYPRGQQGSNMGKTKSLYNSVAGIALGNPMTKQVKAKSMPKRAAKKTSRSMMGK